MEQIENSTSMSKYETKKELENIYFNKGSYGSSIQLQLLILEECGSGWSEVARSQYMQCSGNWSITEDVLSTTICLVEQTLNSIVFKTIETSQFWRK